MVIDPLTFGTDTAKFGDIYKKEQPLKQDTFRDIAAELEVLTSLPQARMLMVSEELMQHFAPKEPKARYGRVWGRPVPEGLEYEEAVRVWTYEQTGAGTLVREIGSSALSANVIGAINFAKKGPAGELTGQQLMLDSGIVAVRGDVRSGYRYPEHAPEFGRFAASLALGKLWDQVVEENQKILGTRRFEFKLSEIAGQVLLERLQNRLISPSNK